MSELLALQRTLVELALAPDAAAFEADPGAYARGRGLPPRDQEAFTRFRDRLLYYRDGVREAIWEPVDRYLPLTQTLLEEAGAWEECRTEFLAARTLESPFYRDVAPTFLGWLASSGWGRDRWPFLLELAHFELVKELVEHIPEDPEPPGLHAEPAAGDRLVLAPGAQVLAYGCQVFEATLDRPEPPPGPCHLLASRGGDGYVQWRVLTAATAALLARGQGEALGGVMADLGLPPGEAFAFLDDLRAQGALLGFV